MKKSNNFYFIHNNKMYISRSDISKIKFIATRIELEDGDKYKFKYYETRVLNIDLELYIFHENAQMFLDQISFDKF